MFLFLYITSPLPINGNERCAKGAKSPDAPSEPCSYTTGCISLFKKYINRSTVSNLTPLFPYDRP
ncbi:MAG: hypothetical protein BWX61_01322 [Bacteroidetes bacterium ADurb.Bin035]|nr:MAG: hypothetical protein BWX61_01322 [Bacteroidetes bacterium ADurb.Bin035]